MNEENPPKKGRKPKTEAGATVGIYLKPETYKRIKAKAKIKYSAMSVIVRQAIKKMVEAEEKV